MLQLVQKLSVTVEGLVGRVNALTMNPQQTLQPVELLTAKQMARRLGISARTVWRLLERGQFPEPIRNSRKLIRWPVTDLARAVEMMAGPCHR